MFAVGYRDDNVSTRIENYYYYLYYYYLLYIKQHFRLCYHTFKRAMMSLVSLSLLY
jgi:hypothetical protein